MTETTTSTGTPELEALIDKCLATSATRTADFDTLKFQTKAGEKFRRGQVRYIGSGATGNHEGDQTIIPSDHFTFSNMILPAGCVGPEHTHPDVEEAFFVLEGRVEFSVHDVEDGTKTASRVLGKYDLLCVPAGVPRSLKTVSEEDARICVIIGTRKPAIPSYPVTSEMHGVTRD
ncbi:quercetin dioxygenase-like cupin family protein [Actinocorallia herbida]|uniref:Quercetin dioxygenase-like cupin family protein n=1 Tax=Actinocorallia herbida TaxID=58109 RepID=A0A3N1D6H8_9ACTN|nr:cupin domain-containing protein [Actinocorallia herbida]ROO89069.1 quercetin dioxygenase-like cupin family protein [Actinocorallia herbida]